jgi:hypothetical protein
MHKWKNRMKRFNYLLNSVLHIIFNINILHELIQSYKKTCRDCSKIFYERGIIKCLKTICQLFSFCTE